MPSLILPAVIIGGIRGDPNSEWNKLQQSACHREAVRYCEKRKKQQARADARRGEFPLTQAFDRTDPRGRARGTNGEFAAVFAIEYDKTASDVHPALYQWKSDPTVA